MLAILALPSAGEAAGEACVSYADAASGNAVVFPLSGQSIAFRTNDGQVLGGPATRHWTSVRRTTIVYSSREVTIVMQAVPARGRVQAALVQRTYIGAASQPVVRRSYLV